MASGFIPIPAQGSLISFRYFFIRRSRKARHSTMVCKIPGCFGQKGGGGRKRRPPFGGGQWLSARPKSCPKKHQVYQVISSSFEYWETTRNWFGHNFKAIPCYQYIQSSSLQRTNLLCFAMAHGPKNTSWPSALQRLWNTGSKTIGNQRWEKGCWERSWKRLLGNPGCSRHLGQQRFTCTSSFLEIKRLEASSCQQHWWVSPKSSAWFFLREMAPR